MSEILHPSQPTELDKSVDDFIKETAAEFKASDIDDQLTDDQVPAAESAAEDDTGKLGAAKPDGETDPANPANPDPDKGTPPGMERLVAREVELFKREEALREREARYQEYESKIKALESRQMPEDFVERFDLEPHEAIEHLGLDSEQIVRKIIAKRLEAQGKEVPPKLRDEIRAAEKDLTYRRELKTIKTQLAEERRQLAIKTYQDQVSAGAREYMNKPEISAHAPTVALVVKQNPGRVHDELMEEIVRDAKEKAARDPNLPLLTYEEAAKRVEKRWVELRGLFGTPDKANTSTTATTPATKPVNPTPDPANKQKPVVQSPDRPLAPWLKKPETEDEGIRAALMEFKRVEGLGKPGNNA